MTDMGDDFRAMRDRRRRSREREGERALRHRCPSCGAAPGQYCYGTEYGLHRERRAIALRLPTKGTK